VNFGWSFAKKLVLKGETYPATDMVGDLAIFNICGTRYRAKLLMIKEFLTHQEYTRGGWKKWAR
jgi:HigB_toxin, RelE-like toxic component of a toxin-antitoxin system